MSVEEILAITAYAIQQGLIRPPVIKRATKSAHAWRDNGWHSKSEYNAYQRKYHKSRYVKKARISKSGLSKKQLGNAEYLKQWRKLKIK